MRNLTAILLLTCLPLMASDRIIQDEPDPCKILGTVSDDPDPVELRCRIRNEVRANLAEGECALVAWDAWDLGEEDNHSSTLKIITPAHGKCDTDWAGRAECRDALDTLCGLVGSNLQANQHVTYDTQEGGCTGRCADAAGTRVEVICLEPDPPHTGPVTTLPPENRLGMCQTLTFGSNSDTGLGRDGKCY